MAKYEVIIIEEDGRITTLSEPKEYENLTFYSRETCKNSIIRIHKPTKFIKGCTIDLRGETEITLGSTKNAYNFNILTASNAKNQKVTIGKDCSFWTGISLNVTEDDAAIEIGDDCMFSRNIEIWASDGHTIYNASNLKVLNKCNSKVTIGNHVWICSNVIITKGGGIGNNSVIGAGSVITSNFSRDNIVVAGNPARIVKRNINWSRKRPAQFEREIEGE